MEYTSSTGHPRSAAISVIWRHWEAGLHSFTLTTSLLIPSHTHKLIIPNKGADYFITTPLLTSCQPPPSTQTCTPQTPKNTFRLTLEIAAGVFMLGSTAVSYLLFTISRHGLRFLCVSNVRKPNFVCSPYCNCANNDLLEVEILDVAHTATKTLGVQSGWLTPETSHVSRPIFYW